VCGNVYPILLRTTSSLVFRSTKGNARHCLSTGGPHTSALRGYPVIRPSYNLNISHGFLGAFAKLRNVTIGFVMSVCLSVRMDQLGSHWADFHEIWYFSILRKTVEKFLKFHENLTQELQEDTCKFMIIPRWTPLKMRNVSDNRCTENQKTHFLCNHFFPENRVLYKKMRKNMVQPDRPDDNIIRRMRFACSITMAMETHLKYVILIAFPRQQWLRERVTFIRTALRLEEVC
jgi:hypothetical protein